MSDWLLLPLKFTIETSITNQSMAVAGVSLPVAEQMKVLGVVMDQRLTFKKHATAVAKSCNDHAQAIQHIRHRHRI